MARTSYSSGRSSTCWKMESAMRSLTRTLPSGGLPPASASVTQTSRELLLDQFVAPVAEGALGELHDVALVHQGYAAALVLDGVLDGPADQALGAGDAHGLDADAGIRADLRAHLVVEEVDDLLGFRRALLPLDSGVDVLGVLAEDDHVEHARGASSARARRGSSEPGACRRRGSATGAGVTFRLRMPPPTGVVSGPLMAMWNWRMASRVSWGSQLVGLLKAFSPARTSYQTTWRRPP